MRFIPNHKGSATLLTMLMAAVIITVGLGFNWLVKEHLKAAEALRKKTEAILKARSSYDTLIYLILNGRMSQREIRWAANDDVSSLKTLPLDGQKVSLSDDVSVQAKDSNGMISLASIHSGALERLVQKAGGNGNASGILSSYLDWIDTDPFVRVNGAEAFYYQGEGLPYGPRNYALQYQEEFQLIKGMNKELYRQIEPHLTLLPSLGFNPNTASDEVLMAYLNIDENTLKGLREYMSKKPLSSDMELFALTGRKIATDEGVYFFPSPFIEVIVSAGEPKKLYQIRAGLDTRQNPRFPYGILYWREE